MAFDVLEKQSWAAGQGPASIVSAWHLADAVGDFGDLQDGVDFGTDLFQFAGAVERGDPITQVIVGQGFLVAKRDYKARSARAKALPLTK